MSGNNENGGGRVCGGCLYYIRSSLNSIRNFPFRLCFLALLVHKDDHFVRSVAILISTILATVSWFEFRDTEISNIVSLYCLALIICTFITFLEPKGYMNKKYEELRKQNQCQQATRQRAQRQQPPARALGNAMEQRQAAAPECRHVQEAPFDFHHAEEPSESSNPVEPASTSSDEPLQQAAPSDSGSNLPRSSTDPSVQSTHSTPLDDVTNEDPRNDEPLQQAAPSDSGSNLPRSSTDPSTQSTRSTPLDDVTNEEPRKDKPLQQAIPSDSGSNLPQSSTDPSTQSTHSTPLDDVTSEED